MNDWEYISIEMTVVFVATIIIIIFWIIIPDKNIKKKGK